MYQKLDFYPSALNLKKKNEKSGPKQKKEKKIFETEIKFLVNILPFIFVFSLISSFTILLSLDAGEDS